MAISDDMQLLKEYASGNSEEAFATLVSRHINLVYSVALRRVGNPHLAEEITQTVFVTLARKGGKLKGATILSGWLYQTARLTAANVQRTEVRRQLREHEAHMQSTANEPEPDPWQQVAPILEEAMAELSETDRNAVILRFFEGNALKEVGAALGTTDDAAKMRISRAVEKMRQFFLNRGITLSSAGLAAAIGENSVQAAPAGLASTVTLASQAAAVTGTTFTLAKGTLNLMAWSKLNIAISVAAVAFAAVEWNNVSAEKQRAAQLQDQLRQQTELNKSQQTELAKLDERNTVLSRQIESAARDTARARNRISAAHVPATLPGPGQKMWADMMKDPTMAKAVRDQMSKTIRDQYSPLVQQLHLNQETTDKFYQLLIDNRLSSLDKKTDLIAVGDRAGLNRAVDEAADEMNAGVKELLGESDFEQYQQYQSGIGDRNMLLQMKNDFVDNPLTDDQQQRLLQAMQTARKDVEGNGSAFTGFTVTEPSNAMEQGLQRQQIINQQVLQQAADFLTPPQLQTLASSQTNMLNLSRAGYAIAQKMFDAKAP